LPQMTEFQNIRQRTSEFRKTKKNSKHLNLFYFFVVSNLSMSNIETFEGLLTLAHGPSNEDGTHPYLVEMSRLITTNHQFNLEQVYFWYQVAFPDRKEILPVPAWIRYCMNWINKNRDDDCFDK
jgi:hypothetical protein